ncbi:MAG: D-alanyl-D-alanine carboxypeptidase [Oscillospiraceae bacterium]|nr:D-alanyl-D-alanine carboxypeptidase [Oscillospiraceae bacterium]
MGKGLFKKLISLSLALVLIASYAVTAGALFEVQTPLHSEAAYLVSLDTDTVIYKKNETKKMYPASLTKIMTAILTLEKVTDIDTMVTAPAYVYDELFGKNASTADIRQGENISVRELLYALLLPSACEAASILADYVGGGSVTAFVDMMNARALELGATNTHFMNPHGLHDPDQYSTAQDMALIMKHALSLPHFEEIASTPVYTMKASNIHAETRTIVHTNKMNSKYSSYYESYMGASKTGNTDESGRNLASVAEKNGFEYMLITMGAQNKDANGKYLDKILSFVDAKNTYDWIFDSFEVKKVASPEQIVATAKVVAGKRKDFVSLTTEVDVSCLLPKNVELTSIQQVTHVPDELRAPINKGDKIGSVDFKLADEVIASAELVAYEDIERSFFLSIFEFFKDIFRSIWFKIIFAIAFILFIVYIAYAVYFNMKRKRRYGGIRRRRRRIYRRRRRKFKW